jgi:hypothetical protein
MMLRIIPNMKRLTRRPIEVRIRIVVIVVTTVPGGNNMAKRRNKARRIREALAEMGNDVTANEVVKKLKAERVIVTPQQVYAVRASGSKATAKSPFVAVLDAKRLVDSAGSVAKAREALNVISLLQKKKPR